MGNFKELRVWRESVDLAVEIYNVSRQEPFSRDFGLRDQIQRAVVSISSNIETFEKLEDKTEKIRASLKKLFKARS